MELFRNQLCLLVWLLVTWMNNHMLSLEAITPHKLSKVKKEFYLSKINQITINLVLEVGHLMLRIYYMVVVLFIIRNKPRHTQLWLTLEVALLQFLLMSMVLCKSNGRKLLAILTVNQMLLSVKVLEIAKKLLVWLTQLCLILKIPFLKWNHFLIYIKVMEFANLQLLWTLLTHITVETICLEDYF